jgi:nucleotide-binding universal stress UspA family protein
MLPSLSVASLIHDILPVPSALRARGDERVLFVLTPKPDADRALMAAHDCARQLGAELHLLRVVPPCGVAGRPRGLVHVIRETQRVLKAARRARRRCDRLFSDPLPAGRVCVRLGSLVDEAVRRSAELDTRLIVMAPELGSAATALADRAGRPVLVPTETASSFSLALPPPAASDAVTAGDVAAT